MSDALSICWAEYDRFQSFSDQQQLNRRSWGFDEALAELLVKMETSSPDELSRWLADLADERGQRLGRQVQLQEGLRNWLKNLVTNRSKKYRSAARLEEAKAKGYVEQPLAALEIAEEVEAVQRNTTAIEWTAMWRIACGESYWNLANEFGMAENTLKSLVLRCRRRLAACFGCAA